MKRAANYSWLSVFCVFFAAILLSTHAAATHAEEGDTRIRLPDLYPYVASDILEWCKPEAGIWVDLGAGSGGVALAVASAENHAASRSTIIVLDPDANAVSEALRKGREKGLGNRLVAVLGVAERMPLPDNSVDLVFSRGSIFFWDDQAQGVREIHRVLRPGGKAMIGGGRGSKYPEWARRELARRRQGSRNPDSPQTKEFARLRDPRTFRQWAKDAGITHFEVVGQGALPADDPRASAGVWLRFTKREAK